VKPVNTVDIKPKYEEVDSSISLLL